MGSNNELDKTAMCEASRFVHQGSVPDNPDAENDVVNIRDAFKHGLIYKVSIPEDDPEQ